MRRGGHDPDKVNAAYQAAVEHTGAPTVILAKTIKGYGLGEAGEGKNITHQQKKINPEELRTFRNRFKVPLSDEQVERMEFYHPGVDSEEIQYLKTRREALGGPLPQRRMQAEPIPAPTLATFERLLKDTGAREMSTTQALVQAMIVITRDKVLGPRLVPIVPDEARTFGREGMFRQIGIYAHEGQNYEPMDRDQLMYYREDKQGQILEEGINEAGSMASWIAAATSYSHSNLQMIPIFIFYSMFGFQRVGDLIWAAGAISSANTTMETNITVKRNAVPQRGCGVGNLRTFSTIRGRPAS